MSSAWYVAQVRTNAEEAIGGRLGELDGVETFVPLVQGRHHRRGKPAPRLPLIRGYVFARFDAASGLWGEILRMPGVIRLLRNHGALVPVKPKLIDDVRALAERDGAIPAKRRKAHAIGQLMRVVQGPFRDYNGTVEGVRWQGGQPIYRLAVGMFGRTTPVELPGDQVEPA